MTDCTHSIARDIATIVVCTLAQVTNKWSKGIRLKLILIDEATVLTKAAFLVAWRGSFNVISIGDQARLGSVVQTDKKSNLFVEQMMQPLFIRFISNGWPVRILIEVIRMTAGLEILTSEEFYNGQLKPGEGTALSHKSRQMSRDWQDKINIRYPLKREPDGLVYLVFFNLSSVLEDDSGASKINIYNIAAVIDHII